MRKLYLKSFLLVVTIMSLLLVAMNQSTQASSGTASASNGTASASSGTTSDFVKHQIGETFSVNAQDGKVFNAVQIKQLKSKYLFIHLQLDQDSENIPVKIYIYKQGDGSPIKVCQHQQVDSCYLEKSQVTEDSVLIILTDSEEQYYSYTLQTYWSDIEHLQPNSSTKFFFSENDQSQLYHLELNTTDFHELRIIIKPQTVRTMFDKVKIYGSFGTNTNPTKDSHDFESMHLWSDAEGIFLYGSEIKNKNINIFIVGEIQTIYTLSCQIINDTHHDLQIGETTHEYLEPNQNFLYHAKFGKTLEFDEYLVTFSGFTGQLELKFYKDKQKKQLLNYQPFQYLNDAQFVFKKGQIKQQLKDGLYIYVEALEKKSVYAITFKGRTKQTAILLQQSTYEFIQIQKQTPQQLAYFQILEWKDISLQDELQYSVSLTNVEGSHELQFRECLTDVLECTNLITYKSASEPITAKMTTIGTKQSYIIKIKSQIYKELSFAQTQATIVIVIKSIDKSVNQNSLVAIQYRAENKVEHLRENKPIEGRVKKDQFKVFKFENKDQQLSKIKVYMNEISGRISVFTLRKQPKQDQEFGKEQTGSVITFTQDLAKKPVYLVVRGNEQAIFSIQVVCVYKSDTSLSAFTLSEDLSFSVKIKPQGSQIFEVVPIYGAIYLEYDASNSILICSIDKNTNDCQSNYSPQINKKGIVSIPKFNESSKMFKVMNPFEEEIVKVTLVYHSKDYAHCEQRQVGTLYYEVIHHNEIKENGNQNNCYHFPILQKQNISVSLSRVDLGEIHYAISICNAVFSTNSQISAESLSISYTNVKEYCINSKEKFITLMISPHKSQEQINTVIIPYKVKYLFEYSDKKIITIPDGVTYQFEAKTIEGPERVFYYDLVNIKDTTVKLIEDVGYGSFTITIVQRANKDKQQNQNNFDYSFSRMEGYFLNPTLTLTKEQIENKKCKQCSLIIKVYSNQQVGAQVKFGIEVSQNHVHLEDNKPKQSFLLKNSFDFYTFTTLEKKNTGSLIIQVNDNGRQCVQIYLSDFDYPDDKNHLESEKGNQLVYQNIQPRKDYYIGIRAKEDCPYSIFATTAKIPISKLKRGVNARLSLKAGEIKYFMIQHLEKKEFKILSILKHGQTNFYINKTSLTSIQYIMSNSQVAINLAHFEIQSPYSNRIVMHSFNKFLTENTYYLLAVEGRSDSEGYLFYGDSETNLQIINEAQINDQLTEIGQVFRGEFYGQGNITLEVTVIAGELNIEMEDQYKQTILNKDFVANQKKPYINNFNIKQDGKIIFLKIPIIVSFKAKKENTVYSFKFEKHLSEKAISSKTTRSLKPGQPNFIYLEKSLENYTLEGTFTHREQLFITVPMNYKEHLTTLELKGYLNGKQSKVTTSIIRNIMKLNLEDVKEGAQQFKIQIKTKVDLSTTVYQDYGLNLFAENTEVMIEGTRDFVLHPEGSVLLDVFECQGNAQVMFSKQKMQGSSNDAKELTTDLMPNQPHAIKLMNPGTTFLRIQSSKSFARWLSMNAQKQQGMGYLNYDIGLISYEGRLLKLTVQWAPVHSKRDTKTTILKVEYTLIIAEDSESVKGAINCENYNNSRLLYYKYQTKGAEESKKQKIQLDLDKSEIIKKYSQNKNLFVGIVADVEISVPSLNIHQNIENYRFIYTAQQIPLQVFKSYDVSNKDGYLIALVGSSVLLVIIMAIYVCVKKIIPLLSRLSQGNNLVEQGKQEKEFDVIPASSDRNQLEQKNFETQDKM